jgi:precorrin-8X/cobalt-precorrin-8 methylmutase
VHAEIWPGVVPLDAHLHPIRDAAQVLTLARRFAELDDQGELGALFDVPSGLGPDELATCVAEEGWILGA